MNNSEADPLVGAASGGEGDGPAVAARRRAGRWDLVAVAATVPLAALVVARGDDILRGVDGLRVDGWVQAQLTFSYEHEFVRRGLLGEVLRLVGLDPHRPLATFLVSAVVYLGLGWLLAPVAWTASAPLPRARRMLATSAVLVLPFSLPHFAFDLGRADVLLYVLVLGGLLLWERQVPLPVLFGVGLVGTLVHELFVLVHVPLWLAVLTRRLPDRADRARQLAAVGCGTCLALTMVVLAGDLDSVPEPDLAAELESRIPGYDGTAHGGYVPAHDMLYAEGADQIDRALSKLPGNLVDAALAAVPGALMLWAVSRLRPAPRPELHLAVATLPGLLLFVTGVDTPRWVALLSFNVLVVTLFAFRDSGGVSDAHLRRARTPLLLLTATVVLGPVGIVSAYPMVDNALDVVA